MKSKPRRLAVYTTVHPGARPFLPRWYESVLSQVDRDFDLWISLDGVSENEAAALMNGVARPTWLSTRDGDTPAEIRQKAIASMVNIYFGIVFVDSDDVLEPTRVEAARAALETHDVIGCGLRVVDEHEMDLGILFGSSWEDMAELLAQYNVFGLSNTAYRSEVLRDCLPLPAECEAIDWLLATRAWGMGARMAFDVEPRMAYRRYLGNAAPLLPPFTSTQVVKATQGVLRHYRCALETGPRLHQSVCDALSLASDRATTFAKSITSSNHVLDAYVAALNRLPAKCVWWWCVAHPELECIWKQ